jgi:hypothetical protein
MGKFFWFQEYSTLCKQAGLLALPQIGASAVHWLMMPSAIKNSAQYFFFRVEAVVIGFGEPGDSRLQGWSKALDAFREITTVIPIAIGKPAATARSRAATVAANDTTVCLCILLDGLGLGLNRWGSIRSSGWIRF